jgi:hypothetical protein
MVISDFGDAAWKNIRESSAMDDTAFLSMQACDDSITFELVAAVSKALSMDVNSCLIAFGKHWVTNTAKKSYGNFLAAYGDQLWDFLENLDHMHDRIGTTFPGFSPPSFSLEKLEERGYELTYRSGRAGLESFVLGLMEGLSLEFSTPITVSIVENHVGDDGQMTKFLIIPA